MVPFLGGPKEVPSSRKVESDHRCVYIYIYVYMYMHSPGQFLFCSRWVEGWGHSCSINLLRPRPNPGTLNPKQGSQVLRAMIEKSVEPNELSRLALLSFLVLGQFRPAPLAYSPSSDPACSVVGV